LVSSAGPFCLARLPTHEFFRAGRKAGRTGTVEEVPQRAAATTLTSLRRNYELHGTLSIPTQLILLELT
jgi:hypothetical protein